MPAAGCGAPVQLLPPWVICTSGLIDKGDSDDTERSMPLKEKFTVAQTSPRNE